MPKKFDTNPLDPEFPDKASAATASEYTAPPTTPNSPYSTAEFPTSPGSITEEETRRFADSDFQAYAYQPTTQPMAVYQTTNLGQSQERKVAKTGLPEKWLIALPYIPFSIGLVAGLILLLIIPKEENKVRFHAAQGLAAHVGILIVTTILGFIGEVTNLASIGNGIFTIFTTVMLIIWAIKAWKGKPVHIESIDDLTNWLEEKIGPLKT